MFGFESNQSLKIHCNTWNKDAHALFDYESEEIVRNKFTLGKGGKIIRDEEKGETKYQPDNQDEGFFLTGGHSSSSEGCLINFFNEYGAHTRVSKKIKDEYIYNKENITEVQNMLYYVIFQAELKGIKREYKSGYNYKKLLSLWLNGFTAFSVKPLRLSTVLGFIVSFVGFIMGLYIIVNKIVNPNVQLGWSSIMCMMFFMGGIVMLMLGMIGEYIGRVYININNKPQYVIKEKIN